MEIAASEQKAPSFEGAKVLLSNLHQNNTGNSGHQSQKLLLPDPIPEEQDSAQPGGHHIAGADNGKQGTCRLAGCQQQHHKISKTVQNTGNASGQTQLHPFDLLERQTGEKQKGNGSHRH